MKITLFTERTWSFALLFLSIWAFFPIHLNDCSKCKCSSSLSSKTLQLERDQQQYFGVSSSLDGTKNVFFSYGTGRYHASLKRILDEATKTGVFDEVIGFGLENIDLEYRIAHADVLNGTRGGGFWLWKSYFLKKLFSRLDNGDVVMYADAGCEFISSPQLYVNLARHHGFVGFRMPHPHNEYTKGDVFRALGLEMDVYGKEGQIVGGIWLFQKNPITERFISEWIRFSEDAQLITDAPSKSANHVSFVDHRHDQSIFGLLVLKFNLGLVLNDQTYPRENSPIIYAARRSD
jgi:hypothetical protein